MAADHNDDLSELRAMMKKMQKAIKNLKKFVVDMFGYMSPMGGSPHRHDDDAMFSKVPLIQASCASCDKDLINLVGKQADYFPWSKFPARNLTEKISKYSR